MRGPYSEYAPPPIYIYPARPKPGIRFSRTELFQLSVAIVALSLALTLLYIRSSVRLFLMEPELFFALTFAASFVAVASGVGLHEIMHKAVAQRYGHWAEFRYNPMGLALAFVFALVGFIYGAPGATWISGMVTREQDGRISAAGPLTNVALGLGFLGLEVVLPLSSGNLLAAAANLIVLQAAFLNLVLAGFNMLPLMPLDGAKVWRWSPPVYIAIVVLIVGIFVGAVANGLLIL